MTIQKKTFLKRLPFVILFSFCFLTECRGDFLTELKSLFSLSAAAVWIEKVRFNVADDMNGDAPVSVMLVIVYDADLSKKLASMPADDFFKKLSQIKSDNPGKADFLNWEVVPGKKFPDKRVEPSKSGAQGAFVFAHYDAPGDHRVALTDERGIIISLAKDDFSISKNDDFDVEEEAS